MKKKTRPPLIPILAVLVLLTCKFTYGQYGMRSPDGFSFHHLVIEEQDDFFTNYHGAAIWIGGGVKSFTAITYSYKEKNAEPEKGEKTESITFKEDGNGFTAKQIFFYDSLLVGNYTTASKNLGFKLVDSLLVGNSAYTTYSFSLSGTLNEISAFNKWGDGKYKFKYKINGNYMHRTLCFRNGDVFQRDDLKFENSRLIVRGKLLENSRSVFHSDQSKISFVYDQNGDMIKKSQIFDSEYTNYKYNEHHDRTQEYWFLQEYGGGTRTHTYSWTYEYDSKGNWTKRIEYELKGENQWETRFVTERTIIYK